MKETNEKEQININVLKETKIELMRIADSKGLSLTAFVITLFNDYLKKNVNK